MGEHWYYRAWSFNTVDSSWSISYAQDEAWTLNNTAPIFGTPNPSNNSANQPVSLTWQIPITDTQGDTFDWTIQCTNGQHNQATGATNGTKSVSLSGLAYNTGYLVYVNATDAGSGQYTRRWYHFQTIANQPAVFGTPTPTNGSTDQNLAFSWSINITDPELESISWTIQCSNGQSTSGGAGGGPKSISVGGLILSSTYKIWVNASDAGSGQTTRAWYTFDTKLLGLPTGATATAVGRFQINVGWTKGTNADRTVIEWRTTDGPWSRGAGNSLGNFTGTTFSHTGRDPGTTYYYRAWGYNSTSHQYTPTSTYFNGTTLTNTPANIVSAIPDNNTENVSLTYHDYSITINDAEGDHMSLIMRAGPLGHLVEVYNRTGLLNGTYVPTVPSGIIPENTTIYILILLYDGYNWTNETYWFKTGNLINVSFDLIYLNSTKTGYNFISLLWDEGVNASDIAEMLIVTYHVTLERVEYWDQALQEYAPAYYDGPGSVEHFYHPGDVMLITVLANKTVNDSGFSPTMAWEDIPIVRGTNWFGRTGTATTAFALGENLTDAGINWTQLIWYRASSQNYSVAFLPGYGAGSPHNFAIMTGVAVFVATNEAGTFMMFGW